MKNIPHQFNDLKKLFDSLATVKELIDGHQPLNDENLGELLTRKGIYTYREKGLSIEEYLEQQNLRRRSDRGHHTVARDTRRFFQLLGFLTVQEGMMGTLSYRAKKLLEQTDEEEKKALWREAFNELGVYGYEGEISHPYRIMIQMVSDRPGIETKKLMLALEALDDSAEEYERIMELVELEFEEILAETGILMSMARNAVKILPGIAEQVGDIIRRRKCAFPAEKTSNEDPERYKGPEYIAGSATQGFRAVTTDKVGSHTPRASSSRVSLEISEALRLRRQKVSEYQNLIKSLALNFDAEEYTLYEGKFDLLVAREERCIIFEIKTVLSSLSDQERQTIEGIGQLRYYKYSIVHKIMNFELENIELYMVYSRKPHPEIFEFCRSENMNIIWLEEVDFYMYDHREDITKQLEIEQMFGKTRVPALS